MKLILRNLSQLIIALLGVFVISSCENKEMHTDLNVDIIPQPKSITIGEGYFEIDENTRILIDVDNKSVTDVANYFVKQLNMVSGYSLEVLPIEGSKMENSIKFLNFDTDSIQSKEAYSLNSNSESVIIQGAANGLFYGVQSLFQLLPKQIYGSKQADNVDWIVPSVLINDTPRFQWRGMLLDVGRHIFPVSFVKKYIDYMAMHKMNTFHWHLTEDQGWRIEIKKYPKLTEIGAWRKGTGIGDSDTIDNVPYGGFYTQEEIREVVAYAESKFITVIPEIELPGHSVAALTAYPELSCTGGPFEVLTTWGISDDIFCAGNDFVFLFYENVLTEVMDLFPSEYIHIGGDEAPKVRWKECSKCQERIKNEGLKDESELQSYFVSRIERFVNSKGRQIIGWDEILEGGLAPNAAVMSWQGVKGGIAAAKQNHYVVMAPYEFTYFCCYAGNPDNEPLGQRGVLPLEKVYTYEPVPAELDSIEQKYIMGVQSCLWTEYIPTTNHAEYMTFPRLCAISEVAWSPKNKRDLEGFLGRLDTHYGRLDELGINYRSEVDTSVIK